MIKKLNIFSIYPVIDQEYCDFINKDVFKIVEEIGKFYESIRGKYLDEKFLIQYRNKKDSEEVFLFKSKDVLDICEKFNLNLMINDQVEIAKKINARGVHLGQSDILYWREKGIIKNNFEELKKYLGNEKIIGISAENVEQALEAQNLGADYVGISAVFSTNTKRDVKAMGIEGVRKIVDKVKISKVAIGGINRGNMGEVLDCGVDSVAMVSEICGAESVGERMRNVIRNL
ncbi:thiamine-phosphate diphosphorylase [Candidatus Peregrinibacteria bacterium RIFOXYC2_FULL_33_13]|nr:MAG: Thiamine-phosphate diphosphorylase [Candidatus Peregrinibacteria bacterium GW2011_GWA2_33_10]KKP40894.1 MAG: thiamine-phosphate pyrophosphorylase, thiamine-phosphate pyrophosphorylase [Candidatus Peregrinibacteria bacterium GW2011_GWC2_33_13]OGJ47350.1 MAG: thiamine-phosphate diphosphorylase [Candidatus Peregrinibacteria bacterium RIFOXYA2_FULL_33_7]OGJ55260.1 MAG: thiamine-phosphate diphosphorylase [Candidatus Peregrinibacteria bacterium RIFOXYC2_FULL_33_13]